MPQPTLLCCNLPSKKAGQLRVLAVRLRIAVRAVEPRDFLQPIGALCGLSEPFDACCDKDAFTDEMLVLAHFPQPLVSRFLDALRAARISVPLKAVLTEANAGWNFLELHEQLRAEREAMEQPR